MEISASIGGKIRIAALVACAAGVSCGSGIHDVNAEDSVTTTMGPEEGKIQLMEGTLDVGSGCLDSQTTIKFQRYPAVSHSGAVGPVFELRVPEPGVFVKDPFIGIATSPEIQHDQDLKIGLLVPGIDQWFPATTVSANYVCPSSAKCADVQRLEFSNPGGRGDAGLTTTVLQLAIVRGCSQPSVCPSHQTCSAGACQQCTTSGPCNR
jgi:hypothetical protein